MKVERTQIEDVVLITPQAFTDDRGCFVELYQQRRYQEFAGIDCEFVQSNYCRSKRGVLRGLHYQLPHPQGKLVWATQGEIYDVAVDLRTESETFGQWVAATLTAESRQQIYVPPGFAHGYCVTSETAEVHYMCTDFYHPEGQHSLMWNDSRLTIPWPVESPLLSPKDMQGLTLDQTPHFHADDLQPVVLT